MADTDEIPVSRFTPHGSKVKFSWVGDPARLRRGSKAGITSGEAKSMLDYDKKLYQPDNSAMFQYGTPRPASLPAYARGWQMPDRRGLATIASRYRPKNGTPAYLAGLPAVESGADYQRRKELAFGQGGTSTAGTIGEDAVAMGVGVENPITATAPTAENPLMEGGEDQIDSLSGGVPSGGGTIGNVQDHERGALTGVQGQLAADLTDVHPITGERMTPEEFESERARGWMSQGGSAHTMHQAQTALGIRPAIDGRAPHAANEIPSPSAGVRAGFGWEPENFGRQAQWLPPTSMSARGAAQQQERQKRFQAARAGFVSALQN